MHARPAEINASVAEMLRPPRRIRVSEAAAQFLTIVNPSGTLGNWSPDVAPAMVEPMDTCASREFESVVFVGPARSGKTVALIDGFTAYTVTCDPADTMIVQTNQSQAEDYSKTRIARAINASTALRERLSPRAHDDNVLLKFFRSGMALRIGWPSLAQLSGKDLRNVLLTDVDNITSDLSIDEAFGLGLKRTQTYLSAGICVAESSPAKDYTDAKWQPRTAHEAPPADGILALYNRGDRRRWCWPCPHCAEYFEAKPGVELFRLPPFEELVETLRDGDPLPLAEKFARIVCPHCGCVIEQEQRSAMDRRGVWVGEGQTVTPDGEVHGPRVRSRTASFWLGGVAAAYMTWLSLLERYFQAVKHYARTGETRPLKSTLNVDQAMPFVPLSRGAERDPSEIESRGEQWTQDHVPAGVRFLTASVDVQGNRFEIMVTGWGPNLERWVIDRYALRTSERIDSKGDALPMAPASYIEDWNRLIDKVVLRTYPLDGDASKAMPVLKTTIDCGGEDGVTNNAYAFWRLLRERGLSKRVRLVKGANSANAPRTQEVMPDARGSKTKSTAVGDVPVVMLNTTTLKDAVAVALQREVPGPGYVHHPKWLGRSYYDELTAEQRTARGWVCPKGVRNESFDLCVYNAAAAILLGVERINWSNPPTWAAEWSKNPDLARAAGGQQQVTRRAPQRAVRSRGVEV
jgi:phage terminase large subunit GpA-like protein